MARTRQRRRIGQALLPPGFIAVMVGCRRVTGAEGKAGIDPGIVVKGRFVTEAHLLTTQSAGERARQGA